LLSGCSGPGGQAPSIFGGLIGGPVEVSDLEPMPASTPAVDRKVESKRPDKSGCGSTTECRVALKSMIESPDRGWIGQQQTPFAYADGTRLFAYRALRRQLTCGELAMAVDELRGATKSMGGTVSGMSPDQLSRTRSLCSQVENELAKERTGRCRG
jgi:hypothetical protein